VIQYLRQSATIGVCAPRALALLKYRDREDEEGRGDDGGTSKPSGDQEKCLRRQGRQEEVTVEEEQ
jgi:hypothetical protein